jgi:hypothetical protein
MSGHLNWTPTGSRGLDPRNSGEVPAERPVYGRDCRDLSQQGKAGGWVPEVLTDRRR